VVAGHQIARPSDDAGKGAADLLEHLVAGLAPEVAVVGAEVIEVDEDQRQGQAVAPRPAPLPFQEFQELLVVGDGGQRILGRQALQLDARRLELGRAQFERLLELRRLGLDPLPAHIGPHPECRQRSYQRRDDRQPVLHSSLRRCTACSMVGHSTPVMPPGSAGSAAESR
jgi:hypothetical protein